MSYIEDVWSIGLLDNLPWEKLSGKNILVTGSTGLIGGCLVDILMNREGIDYHVYASGRNKNRADLRFEKYGRSPWFHFIKHDVTEPLQSAIDFHYMIDAASGANPSVYSQKPVDVMKANFLGVDNLLSYGIKHSLQKFVYVSSGDIYGQGDGSTFDEEMSGYVNPLDLRSCYSSSKRASETLAISYASQYGLKASVARPCHTYGPYFTDSDTRAYAQFIRNALNDNEIILNSTGDQMRSWCYVVDCASALLYILLKGGNGEAYNIADNSANLTIREFATLIADLCGKKVVIRDQRQTKCGNYTTYCLFKTNKLSSLGWSITKTVKNNLLSTINELK